MTNDRLSDAAASLLIDSEALERFRRSPEVIAKAFDLSEEELGALKSGDERRLLALGMDPELVSPKVIDTRGWASVLLRTAARLAVPVAAALLVVAGAGAARANDSIVIVSGRYDGPSEHRSFTILEPTPISLVSCPARCVAQFLAPIWLTRQHPDARADARFVADDGLFTAGDSGISGVIK